MKIPFSLPLIDTDVIQEVNDTLTNTGWLTSGPKVLKLEAAIRDITGSPIICVNSWTSGAMLMLRWFGVGPGDEVIIPSYTYSATALCALNVGAKVIMADVKDDYTIDPRKIRPLITSKTKAIIPVDIGGWPCQYDEIIALVNEETIRKEFNPTSPQQQKLGRILVLSDAAHSLGATFASTPTNQSCDATVFSLHSVKNITTGEGGAIALNLPEPFDNEQEYKFLKAFSLNGQTKTAFEKNQPGAWRYDIVAQGLKVNLPDICAAIGLAQIKKYETELLPDRKRIFNQYTNAFSKYPWAILPPISDSLRSSSCHLFMLRIRGITESERDQIIDIISQSGVGVNVHYIPMPMLTLFKSMGYRMEDYPNTYQLYQNEITLPVYNGLTVEMVDYVIDAVIHGIHTVLENPSSSQ